MVRIKQLYVRLAVYWFPTFSEQVQQREQTPFSSGVGFHLQRGNIDQQTALRKLINMDSRNERLQQYWLHFIES